MDTSDPDYAGFLALLPRLRRSYDRRLHQWVLLSTGRGDSLANVECYFQEIRSVSTVNRQTLRRLVAYAKFVNDGISLEDALCRAWKDYPDPRHGVPAFCR